MEYLIQLKYSLLFINLNSWKATLAKGEPWYPQEVMILENEEILLFDRVGVLLHEPGKESCIVLELDLQWFTI